MSEDKKEKRENRFAEAIAEIAHSPMGYLIGFGLMMLAASVGTKWDGHIYDRKNCVKIQKVDNLIYKVDTCSGQTKLLKDIDIDENSSNKTLEEK